MKDDYDYSDLFFEIYQFYLFSAMTIIFIGAVININILLVNAYLLGLLSPILFMLLMSFVKKIEKNGVLPLFRAWRIKRMVRYMAKHEGIIEKEMNK